jgi:hypothetical protein
MEPDPFVPFVTPHRGVLVLWLGIGAVTCQVLACGCCQFFMLVSVPLALCAWIFAAQDLRGIAAGTVDPSGRQNLTTGKVLGMVALGLAVLNLITAAVMIVFVILNEAGSF